MSKILSHPYLIAAALLAGNQATPLPHLPLSDQPSDSLNPDLLKNSPKDISNLPSGLLSNSVPDDFSDQFLNNSANNFLSNFSNKSLSNSSSNLLVNFAGNSLDTEDTNSNNLPNHAATNIPNNSLNNPASNLFINSVNNSDNNFSHNLDNLPQNSSNSSSIFIGTATPTTTGTATTGTIETNRSTSSTIPAVIETPSPILDPPYPALSFSAPNFDSGMPRFTPPPELPRPKSGSQMLAQRLAALQAGVTYTRIPTDSFFEYWQKADSREPTYEQWQSLLIQEARALAKGQGANPLSIMVGDSISMWFPPDRLSKDRLWLNQGISGENTTQILRRLKYQDFAQTRPDRIYVMAGINDLRQGVDDQTILANHRQIIRVLLQGHPQAQVIIQPILPTRFAAIPDRRLRYLNQQLEIISAQEGASFLNIYDSFLNAEGQLRRELTTDGLHLSPAGYELWSWAVN
jgi:lysophospholipase L1-like esterase